VLPHPRHIERREEVILEIVTPYDTEESCDTHESYESLFRKLAEMTAGSGFDQVEISVLRWRDYEHRESGAEPTVVIEVDELT